MLFSMNGDIWKAMRVRWDDERLVDRTGRLRLATTDPETMTVCVSEAVCGEMLAKVVVHEMGHCAMVSYGLLDDLRRLVKPWKRMEAEEWICNFIADYGNSIYASASAVIGSSAIELVPKAIGLVAT